MPLLYRTTLAALAAAALALACSDSSPKSTAAGLGGSGGHDHGGHDDEDPAAADACEHLRNGTVTPVTASLDPRDAPAIAANHRRYDVSLVDLGDGNFGGVVSFDAPVAGDYVLFLDTNVGVVAEGPGGALVVVHDSHVGSAICPTTVAISHRISMEAGRHTLDFGPDDVALLRLTLEPSRAGDPESP